MKRLTDRWPISAVGILHGRLRLGVLAAIVFLCSASLATAATLSGTVKNGTTNRPVAGVEVVVMQLQQGMEPLAKTKTDSHGRFHFSNSAMGKAPMLVQVSYAGVPYYRSVEQGSGSASIVVYDTTGDPKAILVASRAIVLRPSGGTLDVEEQDVVENQTKPPMAFHPAGKPTFEFQLPDGAQQAQVATSTDSGMPTLQKMIPLANRRQAIDWAFRPGKSHVRISYELPYASSRTVIRTASLYPLLHVFLAAPSGVQVSSDGFSRLGSDDGYDIYGRQSVEANADLAIAISGTGSDTTGANAGNAAANQAAVSTLPARLHKFTWLFAFGLTAILFLATMIFWRRSAARLANASATGIGAAPGHRVSRVAGEHSPSLATTVNNAVQEDIDRIKNELFQLELRRQGGTLSEEDYARERQRVEEALRGHLRG